MGQAEILKVLSKKQWITPKIIQQKINYEITYCSICNCLERLYKHKEIQRRKANDKGYGYEYKI